MGCGNSKSDVAENYVERHLKNRSLKRKIKWNEINTKLATDRSEASKQNRAQLFAQFDANRNGCLSLAEVDKGLREILNVDEVFEISSIIKRGFQKAKSLNPKKSGEGGELERNEFRMLLVYLKNFMAIWEVFAKAEDSDDRRLDKNEFRKVWPKLQDWVPGLTIDECWSGCNVEGNLILFTEFAYWAIDKEIVHYVENPEDE